MGACQFMGDFGVSVFLSTGCPGSRDHISPRNNHANFCGSIHGREGDVHLRCFSNGSHLLPLPSWFGDDVVAPKAFLPARPMVGSFAWFRPLSLHTPWTPLVLLGWPPQNRSKNPA